MKRHAHSHFFLILPLWLAITILFSQGVFAFNACSTVQTGFFPVFGYNGQTQVQSGYDDHFKPASSYDGARMLTLDEKIIRPVVCGSPFAKFSGLLEADSAPLTSTIGDLRAAGLKDAHHFVQDAAVRDLPDYNTQLARGVQLPGPSTEVGTPHYIATQIQRQAGGGTLAAEIRIGYKALRQAGYSEAEARRIAAESEAYFKSIGANPSTPTRIPGNRN